MCPASKVTICGTPLPLPVTTITHSSSGRKEVRRVVTSPLANNNNHGATTSQGGAIAVMLTAEKERAGNTPSGGYSHGATSSSSSAALVPATSAARRFDNANSSVVADAREESYLLRGLSSVHHHHQRTKGAWCESIFEMPTAAGGAVGVARDMMIWRWIRRWRCSGGDAALGWLPPHLDHAALPKPIFYQRPAPHSVRATTGGGSLPNREGRSLRSKSRHSLSRSLGSFFQGCDRVKGSLLDAVLIRKMLNVKRT